MPANKNDGDLNSSNSSCESDDMRERRRQMEDLLKEDFKKLDPVKSKELISNFLEDHKQLKSMYYNERILRKEAERNVETERKFSDERLKLLTQSQGREEACKEKLESITWTVRIRNLIFKVEIIFNLEKIDVCYQCGNITVWHVNRQRCLYDSKTWAFPSNPEGQRIWIREIRWNYLLFTDEEVISGDFRIKNLKKALRAYYDKMKSKKEENKSLAEKALSEIPSYENFVGKFCFYVADICEYCTDRVKNQEQVELSQELRELNEFGIPSDDFMVMLVNAFGRIKKDGPRFLYKEPLDLDVNVFIPKHLRELDGST